MPSTQASQRQGSRLCQQRWCLLGLRSATCLELQRRKGGGHRRNRWYQACWNLIGRQANDVVEVMELAGAVDLARYTPSSGVDNCRRRAVPRRI